VAGGAVRRVLIALLVVAAVFAAALYLTFPTEPVLRRALAEVTGPGSPALSFARAALRPWGLQLDDVTVTRPDGTPLARAEWVTLRPSWLSLLRDRTGYPWHGRVGICRGTADAVLGADDVLALDLRDLDLAACPALAGLVGTAEGVASVRDVRSAARTADGTLTIRAGAWRGAGRFVPGVDTLHLDPATIRWTLADERLALTAIDARGPELELHGSGTVQLASVPAASALALDLVVTPGPSLPPFLRQLMTTLPPAALGPEARRLMVAGTLGAPRLGG